MSTQPAVSGASPSPPSTSSSPQSPSPFSLSRQELALVAVTAFWGSTFLIIQLAIQHSGPLFFVGLRFVTAGLVGTLVFWKRLQGLTRQDLVAGMVIGVSICLGYVLQTWGLKTIPVSQSAFITGLYVPMVPLLQWLVMRRRPSAMNLVGVTLAFAGLALMAGPQDGEFGMTFGAWLTLGPWPSPSRSS